MKSNHVYGTITCCTRHHIIKENIWSPFVLSRTMYDTIVVLELCIHLKGQ